MLNLDSSTTGAPSYFSDPRPEMIPYIDASAKRVLDVGCGAGNFGEQLKNRSNNLEVWGIEPVKVAAKAAESRLTKVLSESVEEALPKLPDHAFDFIVFNDVLEHLVDPWALLRMLTVKLTAGGGVVASIPNIRHYPVLKQILQEADFRYAEYGVLDRTHLRFFTKKSIERLFEDSGYKVQRIDGIRGSAFPWKIGVLNFFCRGAFDDSRFERFAILARPR